MKITNETVNHIAGLSMLDIENKDNEIIVSELYTLLEYMKKLDELNIDNVEPLSHNSSLANVFRTDEVASSFNRTEMLKNAPEHDDSCIIVPKTVE